MRKKAYGIVINVVIVLCVQRGYSRLVLLWGEVSLSQNEAYVKKIRKKRCVEMLGCLKGVSMVVLRQRVRVIAIAEKRR